MCPQPRQGQGNKQEDMAVSKNSDFWKNVKKYLTLTMRCDLITQPTIKQNVGISEKLYTYLSPWGV